MHLNRSFLRLGEIHSVVVGHLFGYHLSEVQGESTVRATGEIYCTSKIPKYHWVSPVGDISAIGTQDGFGTRGRGRNPCLFSFSRNAFQLYII